jgi:hypothetical protein
MPEETFEKKQEMEINDIISDYVPSVDNSQAVQEANQETQTQLEVTTHVEEGQERSQEAPSQQEPTVPEPQVQAQEVTPPPAQEPPAQVTPPVEGQPPTPPPAAPPVQETELEQLKRMNAELIARLNEVAGTVVGGKPPVQPTPEQQAEQQRQQQEAAKQVLGFLPDEETFDAVLKDHNAFNALLTSVARTAVEQSLRLMPSVASQIVNQQVSMTTAVRDFYTDNADLEPHKQYVGFVSNEVTSAHPDWNLTQVLQETEKVVRERLRLARRAENAPPPPNNAGAPPQNGQQPSARTVPANPGFVPGGGGARRGPAATDGNLSGQEKQILDIIS